MWWVRALSNGIKKMNKYAFVVRPGKFYWLKLFHILYAHFFEPLRAKTKFIKFSFAKAIIAFKRNGMTLQYNKQLSS